jgi:hypothetical protein
LAFAVFSGISISSNMGGSCMARLSLGLAEFILESSIPLFSSLPYTAISITHIAAIAILLPQLLKDKAVRFALLLRQHVEVALAVVMAVAIVGVVAVIAGVVRADGLFSPSFLSGRGQGALKVEAPRRRWSPLLDG